MPLPDPDTTPATPEIVDAIAEHELRHTTLGSSTYRAALEYGLEPGVAAAIAERAADLAAERLIADLEHEAPDDQWIDAEVWQQAAAPERLFKTTAGRILGTIVGTAIAMIIVWALVLLAVVATTAVLG